MCISKASGVGPYSQGVRGGGFIYVSGPLALDPVTGQIIEGDAHQQTARALGNIDAAPEASGSHLAVEYGPRGVTVSTAAKACILLGGRNEIENRCSGHSDVRGCNGLGARSADLRGHGAICPL